MQHLLVLISLFNMSWCSSFWLSFLLSFPLIYNITTFEKNAAPLDCDAKLYLDSGVLAEKWCLKNKVF